MTRRDALLALGLPGLWILPRRVLLAAQTDPAFIRMWEDAQKDRPAAIGRSSRIAPEGEPGTPLIVHGRCVLDDGRPAADVIAFAYHTDSQGLYDRPGRRGWRLRGWARTDAPGTFEFRTIRPAPYPGRGVPAHVHLTADGPGVPRQWLPELQFADDPLVTPAARDASARAGRFGSVRPVRTRHGSQECAMDFRLTGEGRF